MSMSKRKASVLLGPQPPGEETAVSLQEHQWQEMGKKDVKTHGQMVALYNSICLNSMNLLPRFYPHITIQY